MRVAVPAVPPQVADTPAPATLKTVLSTPLVKPLTLPSKLMVSVMVSPTLLPAVPATAVPNAVLGAVLLKVGAVVSNVKLLLPAAPALPAASVATALTLIVPSRRVVNSPAVRVTGTGVVPFPVTSLTTVPPPARLNVTRVEAPDSAVIETAPAAASVLLAPLLTPVPRATAGAAGAVVSITGKAVLSIWGILPLVAV